MKTHQRFWARTIIALFNGAAESGRRVAEGGEVVVGEAVHLEG